MTGGDDFLLCSSSLVVRAFETNDTALMIRTVATACQFQLLRKFVNQIQKGRSYHNYVVRCSRHHKCLATLHLCDDNVLSFMRDGKWHSTIDDLLRSTPSECRLHGCDIRCMELGPYNSAMIESPALMGSMAWKSAISIFPTLLNDHDLTAEFVETWIWGCAISKIQ
jgi:hypothetical protein